MKKLIGIFFVLALTVGLAAEEDTIKIKSQQVIRFEIQKPNFTLVLKREATQTTPDANILLMQTFKESNKLISK